MKRRTFLALSLLGFAPAAFADETGIANAIRHGARNMLSDMTTSTNKFRQEASRLREAQSILAERPDAKALEELQRFVAKQHAEATNFLGWLLDHGKGGVPRDSYKAAMYFRRAGSLGSTNGLYNLGLLLVKGRGLQADRKLGMEVLRRAERSGHKHAAVLLGILSEESKKPSEAQMFFSRASSDKRHPYAIFKAGLYTFRGTGASGRKDIKSGLAQINRAADLWSPEAMLSLIEIHGQGLHVPQNKVESAKWFLLAQKNPLLKDRHFLVRLQSVVGLTDEELRYAQQSANVWLRFHPVADIEPPMQYEATIY